MNAQTLLLLACATSLFGACAYRGKDRVISVADVQQGRTKLANHMSAPMRFRQPTEDTPGAISKAAIVDEAEITRLESQRVCVRFTARTQSSLDMPLTEWELTLNGQKVYVNDEKVAAYDYQTTGERQALVAEALTQEAYAKLQISRPGESVFRVIERSATVCGPRPIGKKEIELELSIPQDDAKGNWGERFSWSVQDKSMDAASTESQPAPGAAAPQ